MTAAEKLKRWGCQFCGIGAAQDEKPVPGACREREGAPHSWMNATILEGDPDVLAELNRKLGAANEIVAQTAREALGEKFRKEDAAQAQNLARLLMVEGDGWQTALIEVGKAAASSAAERSIQEWRCWRCGLPAGELAADMVEPHGGGCPVVGGGHAWQLWWAPVDMEGAKDSWERHGDAHGKLRTAVAIGRFRELMQSGVGWEPALAEAKALDEAISTPAPVAEEPASPSSREVKETDESSSFAQPVDEAPSESVGIPSESSPPAKRGRGRPRKDGSAPAVAAPPAPRSSEPLESLIPDDLQPVGKPSRERDDEGRCGPSWLWGDPTLTIDRARHLLLLIDVAFRALATVSDAMTGERRGHAFTEAWDELDRRRGALAREILRLEKGGAG